MGLLSSIVDRVLHNSVVNSVMQQAEEWKQKVSQAASSPRSVKEVDAEDLAARAKRAGGQSFAYVGGARVVTASAQTTQPAMSPEQLTQARMSSGGGIKA